MGLKNIETASVVPTLSDPSVILRANVFVREMMEIHCYQTPTDIRENLRKSIQDTREESERLEKQGKEVKRIVAAASRGFKGEQAIGDDERIFAAIEKGNPTDLISLQTALLNSGLDIDRIFLKHRAPPGHEFLLRLDQYEDVGYLRSERDGFYWYLTPEGRGLLAVLRIATKKCESIAEAKEALDAKPKPSDPERFETALQEYDSHMSGLRESVRKLVALDMETLCELSFWLEHIPISLVATVLEELIKEPVTAELAQLHERCIKVMGNLDEAITVELRDVKGALHFLGKNEYAVFNPEGEGLWYVPDWGRKRAQRFIENIRSPEGKELFARYCKSDNDTYSAFHTVNELF